MIPGDGDGIEFGHVFGRIGENVGYDLHGFCRRVNVSVPHHKLLQNVVLNGAGEIGLVGALLLARDDKHGQDRQNSAVHRHRSGDFGERDALDSGYASGMVVDSLHPIN